jgi:hypothetical protein
MPMASATCPDYYEYVRSPGEGRGKKGRSAWQNEACCSSRAHHSHGGGGAETRRALLGSVSRWGRGRSKKNEVYSSEPRQPKARDL